MAGYTRQDTANNIANGNVIDADDFDAEYNQLESAFNASTGHVHDGTTGNGAPIEKVGPSQDLVVTATKVEPKTTNTLDLGSSGVQFKDAFFDGTVDTDTLTVSGNGSVGGTLTATGGLTGNVTGTVSDVSNHDTDDISEGSSNRYFTTQRARDSVSATGSLGYNSSTGIISFTQGDTDTVSEGSTNLYYTSSRATVDAKAAISVTDAGGDGSLTYSAGAITYTGPSATEARAHFSAGTGVTYSGGQFSIGQSVGTSDNVTFNNTTVDGNLIVNGTTTTVNSNDVNIGDATLTLNSDETGTPSQDAGITIERGTAANKSFHWDESEDEWSVFGERIKAGTFEGDLSGNASTTTKLETARTIDIVGHITATAVSFDGTSNIAISAQVNNNSHDHIVSNISDLTSTASELNKLDGFTGTVTDLNYAKDLRATGVTTSEFDKLDGLTATTTELNKMDGVTATTTELNYVDGVTSSIQTQLNGKASTATHSTATWEGGTNTTERIVSPAKIKSVITEHVIGVGQSWSSVTRTSGTSYRNTTGKPIMVNVNGANNGGGYLDVSANGSTWVSVWTGSGQANTWGQAIVPDDHYYRVGSNDGVSLLS